MSIIRYPGHGFSLHAENGSLGLAKGTPDNCPTLIELANFAKPKVDVTCGDSKVPETQVGVISEEARQVIPTINLDPDDIGEDGKDYFVMFWPKAYNEPNGQQKAWRFPANYNVDGEDISLAAKSNEAVVTPVPLDLLDDHEKLEGFSPVSGYPALTDASGSDGERHAVQEAGSFDFGNGAIALVKGDIIEHDGTNWAVAPAGTFS